MADIYLTPGTGHSTQTDSGAYSQRQVALRPNAQTAAAGVGVELVGDTINRVDPSVALSVQVAIPARLVLASGHDCVISRHIDHRDDSDSEWAVYEGAEPDDVTVTALNDGTQQNVEAGFSADLSGAKAEIRLRVTPNFSASGVDTIDIAGAYVFAGYDTNPAGPDN